MKRFIHLFYALLLGCVFGIGYDLAKCVKFSTRRNSELMGEIMALRETVAEREKQISAQHTTIEQLHRELSLVKISEGSEK